MLKFLLAVIVAAAAALPAQSAVVSISGSLVKSDASVSDYWGTTGNPAIGFTLEATGPISYDYNFTFDAGLRLNRGATGYTLDPGRVVTLNPYFNLQSASLTARQDLTYNTVFSLTVDPPLLDEQSVSINFRNTELGGVVLDLHGTAQAASTGSSLVGGTYGVSSGTSTADAWDLGLDLISLAQDIPVIGTVFTLLDGIGMDLFVGLGIDVERTDFLFAQPNLAPIDMVIPDFLKIGADIIFQQSGPYGFSFDSKSYFDYQGEFSVEFDLLDSPFGTDPITLLSVPLGSGWHVGSVEWDWDVSHDIDLVSDTYTVGQFIAPGFNEICFHCDPFLYNPRFGTRLTDLGVEVNLPTDIPEPATLPLLGLAMLAWRGVHFLQGRRPSHWPTSPDTRTE